MLVWNVFLYDARVTREATTLARNGWDVEVVAIRDVARTPAYEARGEWAVRRVVAVTTGSRFFPSLVGQVLMYLVGSSRLCWAALRHHPQVIHSHDLNTLLAAFVAAKLSGARLVYDAHELRVHQEGVTLRPLWRLLEKLLIGRADAVITTTNLRAEWFASSYRVSRPIVLQNMVEYREERPTTKLSDRLGIPKDVPIVLYQGGVQPGRGLKNLVHAAARVRRGVIVLLGFGRAYSEFDEMVRQLGLGAKVKLLEAVPLEALPAFTASATIGVQLVQNTCLNHYTTDSNKLFEYLMAGLPVVASDLPEIRKVIDAYDVGFLVDPEDPEAIAAAINRLLEDTETYARLRANTRRAALECNWETQEPRLLELYQRLAPPGSGGFVKAT